MLDDSDSGIKRTPFAGVNSCSGGLFGGYDSDEDAPFVPQKKRVPNIGGVASLFSDLGSDDKNEDVPSTNTTVNSSALHKTKAQAGVASLEKRQRDFGGVASLFARPMPQEVATTNTKRNAYSFNRRRKRAREKARQMEKNAVTERAKMLKRRELVIRETLELWGFDESLITETMEMEESILIGKWYRVLLHLTVRASIEKCSAIVTSIRPRTRVFVVEEFHDSGRLESGGWICFHDQTIYSHRTVRLMTQREIDAPDPKLRDPSFPGVANLFGDDLDSDEEDEILG